MSTQPPEKKQSSSPAAKQKSADRRVKKKGTQKIEPQNEDEENEFLGGRFLLFTVVPSWIISLLTHVTLILVAAFFALPKPPAKSISFDGAPPSDSLVESVDISLDSFDDVSEEPPAELAASNPAEVSEPTEAIAPEATVDVGEILAGVDSTMEFETSPIESTSVTASNETSMRTGDARGEALRKYGGSAESESAVKLALKWIVDHQLPDGGWNLNHQLGPGKRTSPDPGDIAGTRNAATALALLPLLGDGHTHKSGEHKDAVSKGLQFLQERGRPQDKGISFFESGGTMYSHGLVSIVLCEAYAMTEDPSMFPFAQGAIRYIENVQNEGDGGWGGVSYRPSHISDTSVVGWQVMALKSAISSGLEVKPRTIKLTKKFLAKVGNAEIGMFGYTTKRNKTNANFRACTAIGVLSRMYLGAEKDSTEIRKGINQLGLWSPDNEGSHDRVTDMYYNYYATQAMKQYGGDRWKTWNAKMRDFLVDRQEREGPATGSWIFDEKYSKAAGRLYATSLACMTLEVYYRFLPLYKETVLEEDFPL
jgi:hypothetical protein